MDAKNQNFFSFGIHNNVAQKDHKISQIHLVWNARI
uniref:Uncharacterized protein n=1 Tax=Arundo donax TaxID=35708 RepID=A0A0A9AFY7_ARUDO